ELEEGVERHKYSFNDRLFNVNIMLNKEICEGCEEKKIRKLARKCGNEEMAKFLHYDCKLSASNYREYIRWIPFDEFRNVEYLAKGGFAEVHKAIWVKGYCDRHNRKYIDRDVVLKRIYKSNNDKIEDILKEVK